MPDQKKSNRPGVENAFHPEILDLLKADDEPLTAAEADLGGVSRVIPLGDDRYGLFRVWESPERGDKPYGVIEDRSVALLAAAFLPQLSKARVFWSQPSEDGCGQTLYRGSRATGHLRYSDPEMIETLNLAEALARSPEALAALLLAVGSAALKQAGKILVRLAGKFMTRQAV